jgi:hypothetical protein
MDALLVAALAVWAALGSVAWIVGSWLGLRVTRSIPSVKDLPLAERNVWPRVSVIVPARDEAEAVEAATRARLAEGYPELELLLVDDRSSDGTGAVADELAAEDPRVRALHVTELPKGWLGKVHALHRGTGAARGDWLLFTDADVHLAPGALRRVVAWAEERGLDHVAAIPEVASRGFLLDAAYAAFGRWFALSQRLWAVEDPRSSASVGVGAFNLVRREAFDRTPGFPWLRMDVTDDLALGLMLKRHGARSRVLNGAGFVTLVWYESMTAMVRGLEKNTFALLRCRLWRALAAAGATLCIDAAPFLALAPLGIPGLPWLGAAALAAGLVAAARSARWARRPILPGLVFPLGSVLLAFILVRAGVLGALRGGIRWRGTFYASEELRRGMRVGRRP